VLALSLQGLHSVGLQAAVSLPAHLPAQCGPISIPTEVITSLCCETVAQSNLVYWCWCFFSHLAAVAMASLPSQPVLTLKLDNVRDVATASFFAYKALAKAVPARPPDIEDIRSLTVRVHGIVLAVSSECLMIGWVCRRA